MGDPGRGAGAENGKPRTVIEVDPLMEKARESLPGFLGELLGHVGPTLLADRVLEDALVAPETLGDEEGQLGVVEVEAAGNAVYERLAGFMGVKFVVGVRLLRHGALSPL